MRGLKAESMKRETVAVLCGVALLALIWIFPPFVNVTKEPYKAEVKTYHYGATILSPTNPYWYPDFGRVALMSAVVIAASGAAFLALRKP